ncbi:hypothetical protein [Halobacterium sp. R2-5]|uniref:DUF7344 domain-containing protein n=1 Tax=Halobacterium sp. R2-5 TaxID=2715751 RepID=UPI00141DFD11|nr:hypothetical protein [Halobacterium sp. R2-5]NIC01029.1 hypothetical protein [Halobacterium sp. R2-5]
MSLLSTLREAVTQNQDTKPEPEIDPGIAYEVLRNQRRRWILQFVADEDDEVVPVRDIADHLSTEHGQDRTAANVSILQSHLPMMADVRVLAYNQQRKTVSLTTRGHRVLELHQAAPKLLSADNASESSQLS